MTTATTCTAAPCTSPRPWASSGVLPWAASLRPMLTRTSRRLRTVRTGYACQPPACRTYQRHRAACSRGTKHGTYAVRVPAPPAAHAAYRGTVAPQVAANLYFSLPVLGFLVWYYGWRLAGKSLALGFFAAAGLVAILFVVVDGADPPPGFGISGVPLGGCAVAYAARGSSNPGLAESGQACHSHA